MLSKKATAGGATAIAPGDGRAKAGRREVSKSWEARRGRTARRLERIEKEMGYCEIKLEKERRLRKQIEFLRADIEVLDRLLGEYGGYGASLLNVRGRHDADGSPRASRKSFLAAGLLEILQEEREILERELEEVATRLSTFSGFVDKRDGLEDEKRDALKDLSPSHSSKMRRVGEDFKRIEQKWNTLTEDQLNLDEALFFLDRNLDYLRSCRTFLITAKGTFDIEAWLAGGYLSDLFRHSSIGRAKEMADGADRNLKMAIKELVCLSQVKVKTEPFQRVLVSLLDALYEDIHVECRLQSSLQVVEAALAGNLKLVEQLKARRDVLNAKVEEVEKRRAQLFSRLDADRREWMVESQ